MNKLKMKNLEGYLQSVSTFKNPNILLEQYSTPPRIAALFLHHAQMDWNDIEGKAIADLGCGPGILSIGSILLGCKYCLSVEIDKESIDLCQSNIQDVNLKLLNKKHGDIVDLIQLDVLKIRYNDKLHKKFDTVIINPPFGTKHNTKIDIDFLETAMWMSNNAVYSFHKSNTIEYILRFSEKKQYIANVFESITFDIPKTYKFHKKIKGETNVSLIRFTPK